MDVNKGPYITEKLLSSQMFCLSPEVLVEKREETCAKKCK